MSSLGPWQGGERPDFVPLLSPPRIYGDDGWTTGRGGGATGVMTCLLWLMPTWIGAKLTMPTSFVLICLVIDLSADLKVQVEDNNMPESSGDRVERRRRRYRRRFRLPENADLEGTKCGLENGVLTVTIPKNVTRETSQKC